MTTKLKYLCALIFVIPVLFVSSTACSCLQKTIFEDFCSSSISVLGTVVAKFDNCPGRTCDPIEDQGEGKIFYIVRVLKLLKGLKIVDDVLYLTTAVNSALCGISLSNGGKYLFNVRSPIPSEISFPQTAFEISLCSAPYMWNLVGFGEKRKILKKNFCLNTKSKAIVTDGGTENEPFPVAPPVRSDSDLKD